MEIIKTIDLFATLVVAFASFIQLLDSIVTVKNPRREYINAIVIFVGSITVVVTSALLGHWGWMVVFLVLGLLWLPFLIDASKNKNT